MAHIEWSLASHKDMYKSFHPLQYILVLISAFAVLALLMKVPLLNSGLRVTPFILVSTVAAMFGDFWLGIFSIVLCSTVVDLSSSPVGFEINTSILFKTGEFAIIAITIFFLSWRSRRLHASNIALRNMTETLQDITLNLQSEAIGNKKQLKKLNVVNKDLISLVNKFVEDDNYWERKLTQSAVYESRKQLTNTANQTEK